MELYNIKQFDLDCTYSSGQFWKNITPPLNKSDLKPKNKSITQADSANLPYTSESMNSIMFDPPFVIAGKSYQDNKKGSSIIAKRFEGYETFKELKTHYKNTLKEAHRLLKPEGILVVKCQDTVSSGKNHFTHCLLMNMAIKTGYHPRDLFILVAKHRINSYNGTKWKQQFHARKHHSYFWVLQKTKQKVNYSF